MYISNNPIEALREKLQRRLTRLNQISAKGFHSANILFWDFLHKEPLFSEILQGLAIKYPGSASSAREFVDGRGKIPNFDNEIDHVTYAYFILRESITRNSQNIEASIGSRFVTRKNAVEEIHSSNQFQGPQQYVSRLPDESDVPMQAINQFKVMFIDPLCMYLEEQLDGSQLTLNLLLRYKHKCEWFNQTQLHSVWQSGDDKGKGENSLALHLYEYFYDQGLAFEIEPSSLDGKIDMIESQKGTERLMVDTKIFKDKGEKSYIAKGFRQMYRYTKKYNQPVGYLVIFKTTAEELQLELDGHVQSIPYLQLNNKTIYALTIDLYKNPKSPSQTNRIHSVKISREDIIKLNKATPPQATGY